MGRPLTGSVTQRGSRWQASVPRARGDSRRVKASFDSFEEADRWRREQILLIEAGGEAGNPAPDMVREPPSVEAGLARVRLDTFVDDYLRLGERQRRAQPERLQDRRRDVELHLLPYFRLWGISCLDQLTRDVTTQLPSWLAGRPVAMAAPGAAPEVRRDKAMSVGHAKNVIGLLKEILREAATRGHVPEGLMANVRALKAGPDRPAERRAASVAEVAEIAEGLSHIHQAVLWVCRLAGLRVAEVYGLTVADFTDCGEHGWLTVDSQGGRTFRTWDADEIVTTKDKRTLKTISSHREVLIPAALVRLLRLHVQVWHADPVTGEVDPTRRLIPGIGAIDASGMNNFQTSLKKAVDAWTDKRGLDDTSRVTAKDLRAAYVTAMQDLTGNQHPDLVRRQTGHEPIDVHAGTYYLTSRESLIALLPYVQELAHGVEDNLLVPSDRWPQFGKDNPLRGRREHCQALLEDAGWWSTSEPDRWLTSGEVARTCGVACGTARRWLREGTIPGRQVTDPAGGTAWVASRRAVESFRAGRERRDLSVLAAELGATYHQLWSIGKRLFPDASAGASRRLTLDPDQLDAIAAEHERLGALHQRSMTRQFAADELSVHPRTITRMVEAGELEQDPETDGNGWVYVTRQSVARLAARRRGAELVAETDVMTMAEAQRHTGLSRKALASLVRADKLVQQDGVLTIASLRDWATGYRPELLAVLPASTDG